MSAQRKPRRSSPRETPGQAKPEWRAEDQALLLEGRDVVHFKRRAPKMEAILALFEAAGWKAEVALVPDSVLGLERERVHNAISNLNRRGGGVLHFWQEGDGTRLCWKRVEK